MPKIKPVQAFAATDGYMYVIDEKGQIWRKHLPSGQWTQVGNLPEQIV